MTIKAILVSLMLLPMGIMAMEKAGVENKAPARAVRVKKTPRFTRDQSNLRKHVLITEACKLSALKASQPCRQGGIPRVRTIVMPAPVKPVRTSSLIVNLDDNDEEDELLARLERTVSDFGTKQ